MNRLSIALQVFASLGLAAILATAALSAVTNFAASPIAI
jgi:hypothetical protein